jgi:arabinofuranosyltransferase
MTSAIALEMITRTLSSLRGLRWFALPWVLIPLLTVAASFAPKRVARVTRFAVLVLSVGGALWWAWDLRWLCDDAFISFRYADNLLRGHGLVYNVGERVEGYTNFLWTMLLAAFASVGVDIPRASIVLSLLAFVALLAVTYALPALARPERARLGLPLAAIACAAQYSMASFATSGLETMFGSLLVAVALERALNGRWFAAGTAGVAAAMTHPDLGLLYAALGAAMLLDRDARRHAVRYALPFAVFYLPYFAWRFAYYGDLFPNTYYAKSANLAYFSQGAVYLSASAIGGGFWALLPLAVYAAAVERRSLFGRYCIIGLPLFCVYVAKIGGDFMYGRLLCPITAPLLVLCELGVARLLERRHRVRAFVAAAALLVVAVPARMIGPLEKAWQIADERTFYKLASLDPLRVESGYFHWAQTLIKYFPPHAAAPHISMYSAGMISYVTGWPMLDGFGLTDRFVAHRPIVWRGRPGHEKRAPRPYIVSRGVDISDEGTWPPAYAPLAHLSLDGLSFNLVHYDPKLMKRLQKKPGVSFQDFERRLAAQARAPVIAGNAERVACDAWFAEAYYFSRVPDSPQRPKIERQLLRAGRAFDAHAPPGEVLDLDGPRRAVAGTALHFDPGERARFTFEGGAFRSFPTDGTPVQQEWVTGQRGTYASSFDPELGDAARGTLRTQPFPLVGDVMEFYVGGGLRSAQLHVSLIVDGVPVLQTGGCDTEMMGRRLWQIAPFKGKQAVLEIVDDSTSWFGHLMVDEVVQWSLPAVTPPPVPAAPEPTAAPHR